MMTCFCVPVDKQSTNEKGTANLFLGTPPLPPLPNMAILWDNHLKPSQESFGWKVNGFTSTTNQS